MGATLVLDIALKTKSKKAWLGYALLICLGMWTHYFTALAWLAHFAYIVYYFVKNGLQKAVFWAYPLAVGLFLPWIPFFLKQSDSVQQGFWIPPVSFTTPMSFVTESLIFHDAATTTNWLVVLVIAAVIAVAWLLIKSWQKLEKAERKNFGFLATVILLPPAILMLLSMEPFQPTYMTRYVTYAASLLWVVIGLAIYWAKRSGLKTAAVVATVLVLICAAVGITAVDTRNEPGDLDARAAMVAVSTEKAPVLIHVGSMHYYDLLFYETEQNPVYVVDVNFEWGSLEPMREYKMNHLEDKEGFIAQHDNFWMILEAETDAETGERKLVGHFIGLGPTAQEEVSVKIGRDCIADDDGIVGDSVVDAFNLAGAELDIIVDTESAVATKIDLVGENECRVDEIDDFGVIAMLRNGVANDFDVGVGEHAVAGVAKARAQIRTHDVGAIFGVIFLATNHAAIMQQAGDVGQGDFVIGAAGLTGEICCDT